MRIRCLLGRHLTTSYYEQVRHGGAKQIADEFRRLTGIRDRGQIFLEMNAQRCKHCSYTFNAKTKTIRRLMKPMKENENV